MNKKKKNNNSIGYSGKVTVKLEKNGKILRMSKGHNNGREPLFTFIANCLANNYVVGLAPRYIRVLHTDELDSEGIVDDATVNLIQVEIVVDSLPYTSVSTISDVGNNTATAQLTFTLPGNLFTDKIPNLLALYSVNSQDVDKPLATYSKKEANWELVEGPIDSDVNVIVIWELSVGNVVTQE